MLLLAHGVGLQTPDRWLHYSGASGEWTIMACVGGVEWKELTNLLEAEKRKGEGGHRADKRFNGMLPVACFLPPDPTPERC